LIRRERIAVKLWLFKNKRTFSSSEEGGQSPEWYGWAGDDYICAIVSAETSEEAWAILRAANNDPSAMLWTYGSVDFGDTWTVEELVPAESSRMMLLVYGAY